MFLKQFITIPHSKDLFFRVKSHAFKSFISTLLCENRKCSLILSGCWNNRVMGSWTTWFLDFNKRGVWNKRNGAKIGPFLINVVSQKTKLWLENSQKINCRNVTSIWEGRVYIRHYEYLRHGKKHDVNYFYTDYFTRRAKGCENDAVIVNNDDYQRIPRNKQYLIPK